MISQTDTIITRAGRELIYSCIKDSELRDRMLKYAGGRENSCVNIIGGSLKTLDEKRTVLEQLRKEVSSDYVEAIDSGLEQLDTALDMLYNVDRDRGILLVSGVFYSEDERGHDTFDGPFPVASWDAAQTLMKQYVDDDPDEDWSESFWQIKLYTAEDLHDRPRAQASLIFAATMTGDLAFLSDRRNQRTPHQSIDHLLWNNSKHFCANGEVFYTPWSPGDIIKIDSRPFDHGPRFAIVLEDDYDSSFKSQVWCAYPSKIYGVEEGNLRLRDFTDGFLDDFTPSALYTAERYIGDLPDDCSFMLELSKKLHDDPSYRQTMVGRIGRTRLPAAIPHIGRRRRQHHTFGHSRVSRLARYQRAFGWHRLRAHHARGGVHRRPFERKDAAPEDRGLAKDSRKHAQLRDEQAIRHVQYPQLPCLSSRRHQMGAQENRPVQTTWQAHVFL